MPELTLSVTAAEVRGSDRTLRVQVGQDGCVAIHRPSYYKAAGEFRLQLLPSELTALRALVSPELLRTDASALSAEIAGAQTRRAAAHVAAPTSAAPTSAEGVKPPLLVLQVADPDRYVLQVGSDSAY